MYIEEYAAESFLQREGKWCHIQKRWLCFMLVPALMLLATGIAAARGLYDKPPELERMIEELLENNEELAEHGRGT